MINKINFQKKLLEKGLEQGKASWKEKKAWEIELKSLNKILKEVEENDFPEVD